MQAGHALVGFEVYLAYPGVLGGGGDKAAFEPGIAGVGGGGGVARRLVNGVDRADAGILGVAKVDMSWCNPFLPFGVSGLVISLLIGYLFEGSRPFQRLDLSSCTQTNQNSHTAKHLRQSAKR